MRERQRCDYYHIGLPTPETGPKNIGGGGGGGGAAVLMHPTRTQNAICMQTTLLPHRITDGPELDLMITGKFEYKPA